MTEVEVAAQRPTGTRGRSPDRPWESVAGYVLFPLAGLLVACLAAYSAGAPQRGGRLGAQDSTTSSSSTRTAGVRDFITYFSGGQESVLAGMREEHYWRPFEDVIEECSDAVVRIRVQYNRRGGSSYSTDHGSGFVLSGGRHVVTAAHVVDVLDRRDDCEILVALSNGRVLTASDVARVSVDEIDEDSDWAVLELEREVASGLVVGRPGPAPCVAVMGFPEQIGLSHQGVVVADAMDRDGMRIRPVVLLGDLEPWGDRGRRDVDVAHGAIPMGGISGGPVLDRDGVVVAIDTGVRRTRTVRGSRVTCEWYVITHPVDELRAWLQEHLPGAVTD